MSVAPGFSIENIFVFPGVPKIMQVMFKEKIRSLDEGLRYYKKTVSTKLSEGIIGEYILRIYHVLRFEPVVIVEDEINIE